MEFLNKYKVIVFGFLSAIALAASELMKTGEANTKVLIFAAVIAGLSYLANNLRGQVASIIGLVGAALVTYLTMEASGNVSWAQLALQFVVAILAVLAPPPKSRGYEHSATIVSAKADGEAITPSPANP